MPDPISVPTDWFGRGITAVVVAAIMLLGNVFRTRQSGKSSDTDALTKRMNDFMTAQNARLSAQDEEIAGLRSQMTSERADCERRLADGERRIQRMQAEINRLMAAAEAEAPAVYGSVDIDRAQRVGRAAQKRQRRKSDATDS